MTCLRSAILPPAAALLLACSAGYVPTAPDSILYRKGVAVMADREYNDAMKIFRRLLKDFPEGDYADDARFHVGYLYVCHKNPEANYGKALDAFRSLVSDHPNSEWKYEALNWIQVLESRADFRRQAASRTDPVAQPSGAEDSKELTRLTTENKGLKSENGRLQAENSRLTDENAKLKSVLQKLEAIDR